MQVEFFSAECRLCETTLSWIEDHFPEVDITVHRDSECIDGSCCRLAEQYGVKAVPSLVVGGQVVLVGCPSAEDLVRLQKLLV